MSKPNSVRNPKKKRGRPAQKLCRHKYLTDMLGSRNYADMISASSKPTMRCRFAGKDRAR
jgi:hypothetical protein